MASITFAVDDELKSEMSEFSWVNWSELVKQGLIEKIKLIEFLESKLNESKFTEEDADRLGELAKLQRLKELKAKGIL